MSVMTLPHSALTYPQATNIFSRTKANILPLAKAIAKDGLLNPILVRRTGERFTVIDGKKRVMALRLLSKFGSLPRSLSAVPCIDIDMPAAESSTRKPLLKTDAEFVNMVCAAYIAGATPSSLAKRFDCDLQLIEASLSVQSLHENIREYFQAGHLSLEQAAAFATLPNPNAQWALLQQLGPFAHAEHVIASILAGDTVIEMPDGDTMILPSRATLKIAA